MAMCGGIALLVFRSGAPPKPHTVTLTWHPPTTAGPGAVRYNVYRGTTTGGPYVRIATGLASPKYDDALVNGGRIYFYVVTSVDAAGKESRYSAEIGAPVP